MEWEKIVGANIRRFRRERGLTQEHLALAADIDLRYLGGIERGEHNPTLSVLGRFPEFINLSFTKRSGNRLAVMRNKPY